MIFAGKKGGKKLAKDFARGDKQKSLNLKGKMEAAPGFEPGNKGFAGLCLTTWLCRLKK